MNDKLKQELALLDWNSPDAVVNFYESNKLYFNNIKIEPDIEKSAELIDIKISYCFALIDKGHFTKSYDITKDLNINFNRIENKDSEYYKARYERYLFAEGIALSRLKRYEESQSSFKELIQIDPDKDVYKDWDNGNKARILKKQASILVWAGFGLIILDMLLDVVFNVQLGKYGSLTGFIVMTIGFSLPYLVQQIKN